MDSVNENELHDEDAVNEQSSSLHIAGNPDVVLQPYAYFMINPKPESSIGKVQDYGTPERDGGTPNWLDIPLQTFCIVLCSVLSDRSNFEPLYDN